MTCALLAVLLMADPRPTASDVAISVELSRSRLVQRDLPPTQDQIDESVARSKLEATLKALDSTQRISDPVARSAAARVLAETMEGLRREIADAVSRQQMNARRGTELDTYDISRLATGGVGALRTGPGPNDFTIRCITTLGPDKSLLHISQPRRIAREYEVTSKGAVVVRRRTVPHVSATVILKGHSTHNMAKGNDVPDLNANVVATGREVLGRPVPVLEVFAPDRPFNR
ncbi:MAG TPA: hypothetical protein VM452_08135 [Caulifigura sp.]|jgi:hypothetical protein|nr:hypothetical protein [Caulifigura sp.]